MSNVMAKSEVTTLSATDDYLYVVVAGASDGRATPASLFKSMTGDYSTRALSLSSALSAIGSNQGTIEIPASVTVSANTSIPNNVSLVFTGTGGFSVDSGKTLTIAGPIIAPSRQIFSGAGAYAISSPQPLNIIWFGAKGDAKAVIDGSMSSSGTTLTSSLAAFVSSDVGKAIDVQGTGASATDLQSLTSRNNKVGTISAYISATQVTLSFSSSATVSDRTFTYGTDDSDAVSAALAAASGNFNSLYFPPGGYLLNDAFQLSSNLSLIGDGQGVSVIYWVGPTRDSTSGTTLFNIADTLHDVSARDLSILGTNVGSLGVNNLSGLCYAFKVGTGAGGAISRLNFVDAEIGQVWGMGLRSDGDSGDQAGSTPTITDIKVLGCNLHHNADNAINLNTGGGLIVANCRLTDNAVAGIEFAGSRLHCKGNYVARNRNVGIAPGGLGNPSFGKDIVIEGNIVERNGYSGSSVSGIQIGGNLIHCVVANNIVRENAYQGIGITDGNPDFASLSRDVRIVNNIIASNGLSGTSSGINCAMNDVVIAGNDVFDDGVASYSQYYGILCKADNVKLIHNNVHNNANTDIIFVQNSNSYLVRDEVSASISTFEGNGWAGNVDTSSTTATWKSGDLFDTRWVGVPIKINSVAYTISAVAAAPTGSFTISGTTVTRTSGPSFDTAWVNKYIKLATNLYFQITAVASGNSLTISNPYSHSISNGTWTLYGSVSLTLSASAGTQSNVAYVIPPHVKQPGDISSSLVAVGSAVALTTATPANVTSLVLGPGNWDVEGNVNFTAVGGTQTAAQAGINTTSATLPTDGSEVYSGLQTAVITEKDSITLPRKRVSVSSGIITVYMVAQATFAAGTVSAFGGLSARRV